jgi:hypothetical protein
MLLQAAVLALVACGGGSDTDTASTDGRKSPTAAARVGKFRPVDATALMDWAEINYPQFFPTHEENKTLDPYIYRYYPDTENYLGLAGDDIYVLGPVSGKVLLKVGTVADFACRVYPIDNCSPTLTGTAASGKPLINATVTVKDATGRVLAATTDASGNYSLPDVSTLQWPVLARVEGGFVPCDPGILCLPAKNTEVWVGVSSATRTTTNVLNLTPLTHAIVTAAAGAPATTVFDNSATWGTLTPAKLKDATTNVVNWIKRLNPQFTPANGLDFLNGPFKAISGDQLDAALDAIHNTLAALQLDLQKLAQLVMTPSTSTGKPPVALFCDVAGDYSGTYTGSTTGRWDATLDAYTGVLAGNVIDPSGLKVPGIGSVRRTGVGGTRTSAALGVVGVANFNGNIAADTVFAGSWTSFIEPGGTFTGKRTKVAAGC